MKPIRMPALSDTMQTGRLVGWRKRPGDPVHKGDVLAEVESDKAIMDVEAFDEGWLAGPLAEPGRDIPVGEVIGWIAASREEALAGAPGGAGEAGESSERADTAEAAPESEPAEAETQATAPESGPAEGEAVARAPATEPSPPPAPAAGRASPYARALARDLGIDLAQVAPGPDGHIHAAEVLAAALQPPLPDLDAGPPWRLQLATPMRRAVAEHMQATVHIPSFRVSARLSLHPLHAAARERGQSLTLLLARACALTVREFPHFNAAWTPRGLALRERVDVGIAVDIPGGLVTPVLRDVAGRPLAELAADWRRLRQRAARQRLAADDYRGATFYLSNLGVFDVVSRFDAIVPLGAAAILAVAAEQADGQCEFTLTCDHRVVYGAEAARFLGRLGERLAAPADWPDAPSTEEPS